MPYFDTQRKTFHEQPAEARAKRKKETAPPAAAESERERMARDIGVLPDQMTDADVRLMRQHGSWENYNRACDLAIKRRHEQERDAYEREMAPLWASVTDHITGPAAPNAKEIR